MEKEKEEDKKILVWDGIFQGYKYITKKEMEERKKLQEETLKWFGIGAIVFIILFIVFIAIELS